MNLHDRINERILALGYKYRQVDVLIGKAPGYISNMLTKRAEPSANTILSLAGALRTTPNDLLGYSGRYVFLEGNQDKIQELISEETARIAESIHNQVVEKYCPSGRTPHISEVIGWSLSTNGILRSSDDINKFFTTYSVPEHKTAAPQVVQLGGESLAAKTLNIQTPDQLNRIIRAMPESYTHDLTHQQITINGDQPYISLEKIKLNLPQLSINIDFEYVRLYLRLHTEAGKKVILNFSEPIQNQRF